MLSPRAWQESCQNLSSEREKPTSYLGTVFFDLIGTKKNTFIGWFWLKYLKKNSAIPHWQTLRKTAQYKKRKRKACLVLLQLLQLASEPKVHSTIRNMHSLVKYKLGSSFHCVLFKLCTAFTTAFSLSTGFKCDLISCCFAFVFVCVHTTNPACLLFSFFHDCSSSPILRLKIPVHKPTHSLTVKPTDLFFWMILTSSIAFHPFSFHFLPTSLINPVNFICTFLCLLS